MTCDKCYHNEVCTALYEMNGVPRIGATECAYYKDKTRVFEVVLCEECTLHKNCRVEDAYNISRMPDCKMFCAVGKRKKVTS